MVMAASNENMDTDAVCPNGSSGDEDRRENMSPEEYEVLDTKLDQLNSALDFIERKNDDIHAKLLDLLKSNQEVRQELQKQNSSNAQDKPTTSG